MENIKCRMYDIFVAASRGGKNNSYNSNEYIQKLEMLGKDFTNTITSVSKDNLIIEINKECKNGNKK